jgi:carbonic anhydrase/acetyltransferase-like protein (isoleucine patch superfamily)
MYKVKHLLLVAALAAASLVVSQTATAGPSSVQCSGTFSGTATDLVVTGANVGCNLVGATITHDVVVGENAYLSAANTTIGHDLVASKPGGIITGFTEDGGGPVKVGHDVLISEPLTDQYGNHSCCPDLNDLTVGHDLRITNLLADFEIGADNDNVGHDLVVSGNSTGLCCGFGPIIIGDNNVGHDLVVTDNTTAGGDYGWISVFENTVGRNATCAGNSPTASKNSPGQIDFLGRTVGPNLVGNTDSCD